jgi:hypothetical protein
MYLNSSKSQVETDFQFSISSYFSEINTNERIKSVILSTYRINLHAVERSFPALFCNKIPIPALIFHGDRNIWDKSENIVLRKVINKLNFVVKEVIPQYLYKTNEKEKLIRGVHHPKYMMIFTDKGLHFIVTSANFNGSKCIDGSWFQFFPFYEKTNSHQPQDSLKKNDFGEILEDFLVQV